MVSMRYEDTEARKNFNAMLERAKNPSSAMGIIAIKAWRDVIDHFKKEQGPDNAWPSTIRGGAILQDTGRLRQTNRWRIVDNNEIHVYNQTKYAAIHNYGSDGLPGGVIKAKNKPFLVFKIGNQWVKKKSVVMPKREFMWLSDNARKTIARTIIRYLATGEQSGV